MDRALDDVISERQVGTMASARKQLTAADVRSFREETGGVAEEIIGPTTTQERSVQAYKF